MARNLWRVSYPVVIDPVTGLEHLAVVKVDIPDARGPYVLPTMCYVIGPDRSGVWRKFTIPILDHTRASHVPKHFIECDTIQAPSGELVDPIGNPLNPEDHRPIETKKGRTK